MTTRTPTRASSSRSSAPAPAKAAGKTGAKKATGGAVARRPATRKTAAKSGAGSKTPARKAPAQAARKTAPAKKAAKSAAAKKPAPAKKTPTAKSASAAKAPAKKPSASKGTAPKAPAKKPAAAKKAPVKKAAAAKAPVKKASAAKKSSAKPVKASSKAAGKTTAKAASAKAPAKKAAKKAPAKTPAAKAKTPAKSVAAAKVPPKKAGTASAKAPAKATKTPPKAAGKATAKKSPGGKSAAAKKAPAKKQVAAVPKPVAKKPVSKKTPASKPVAKKAPARKPAPKKRVPRFSVGDRVAHPRHGTAVITGLKQLEADGEKRDGFVLGVFVEQLTVPVPTGGDDQAIRPIVSKTAAGRVLRVLRDEPQEADSDWRVWYKALGEKKDSGDIFQAAEVVRDLTHAKNQKRLSDTLKRMLSESRRALIGEIAFALEIGQEEAAARVDKALTVSAKPPAPPKPAAKKAPARKRAPRKQSPKNRASRFSVGDKVAHPQHGVAVITGVKQIDLDGEERDYFVLDIFIEQLTVSVPMDSIDQSIRPVISKTAVSRVLRVLRDEPQDAGSNWSRWYKVLGEKKDSGDIYQVAEVVRDLTHSQNRKGISPALKRMLSKSRQILTGEIAFALNVDQEEAAARVDKVLPLSESRS